MDMWQSTTSTPMYIHPSQLVPPSDEAMFDLLPATQSMLAPVQAYTQPHMLRSHPSSSSLMSQESGYSDLSWSTAASMAPMQFTESPPAEAPASHFGGQGQHPVLGTHQLTARPVSLSIDPKLFQPKSRTSSGTTVDSIPPADEDEDGILTAKPPKTPRAKPKKANGGERKVSHARKQHPNHIPRPRNAFILFRKHVVDSKLIPASVEMRHQNVSIITAKMWAEASPEQKAHFAELAKIEKEEHMKKYPGYRYQPVYRRTNVIRRRVRKDEAEEEKCRSVAELLMKGKSGQELESEIKEKTKRGAKASARPSPEEEHASSRRDSGAVALSKGALRALRAQARQSSVSDWSDISRCNSTAPSLDDESSFEGANTNPFQASSSYSTPEFESDGQDVSLLSDTFDEAALYADPPPLFQHPSFGFSSTPWAVAQQHDMPMQQTYAYPQPAALAPNPEFYAYDQALPFSPSAAIAFSQQQQQQQQQQAQPLPLTQQDVHPNMAFAAFGESLSPLAPRYLLPSDGVQWDPKGNLPPSSGLPLNVLDFSTEVMLDDFGAALAQAQELGTW